MIELAWPWLWLLLPLPWLVRRSFPAAPARVGGALYAPFALAFAEGGAGRLPAKTPRRLRLGAMAVWICLLAAACRPQWLGEPINLPQTGRNLILAIDVSGSMQTPDLDLDGGQASRLEVVKQMAGDFIQRRRGDRVGLILFGTRPYLQSPLTFDHQTVRRFLDEAVIGVAGRKTAIGDAIGLALKRLRQAPGKEAVLVLLTDGSNTAGNLRPRQAARLAAQSGLRIYTIGVGGAQMRVQGLLGTQVVNPAADLDESTLKAVASITGGAYFRARNRQDLEKIYQRLDRLEPVAGKGAVVRPVTALYPWPLGVALVLSLLLGVRALLRREARP